MALQPEPWGDDLEGELAAMSGEERKALAKAILENVKVREFMKGGRPVVELRHLPTGIVVERVRGSVKAEAYREAFKELAAQIIAR